MQSDSTIGGAASNSNHAGAFAHGPARLHVFPAQQQQQLPLSPSSRGAGGVPYRHGHHRHPHATPMSPAMRPSEAPDGDGALSPPPRSGLRTTRSDLDLNNSSIECAGVEGFSTGEDGKRVMQTISEVDLPLVE